VNSPIFRCPEATPGPDLRVYIVVTRGGSIQYRSLKTVVPSARNWYRWWML